MTFFLLQPFLSHKPTSFHEVVLFVYAASEAQKYLFSHFADQGENRPILKQHKLPIDVHENLPSP